MFHVVPSQSLLDQHVQSILGVSEQLLLGEAGVDQLQHGGLVVGDDDTLTGRPVELPLHLFLLPLLPGGVEAILGGQQAGRVGDEWEGGVDVAGTDPVLVTE